MPSSVIRTMTYEPESRVLKIEYRCGRGTYKYFDVPMEEWLAFRRSGSKGTYLNEAFKVRGYRYVRVDDTAEATAEVLRWPERDYG